MQDVTPSPLFFTYPSKPVLSSLFPFIYQFVYFVNNVPAAPREITARLGIDWTWRPFSRCLVCNSPLAEGGDHHLAQVPDNSREQLERVFYCPACCKLFLHGSHVARMRRKLMVWKRDHEQTGENDGLLR